MLCQAVPLLLLFIHEKTKMRIEHVAVAGLREKTVDSTNAPFKSHAFLSCSPPVGGKLAPYCSGTRLTNKEKHTTQAVVVHRLFALKVFT